MKRRLGMTTKLRLSIVLVLFGMFFAAPGALASTKATYFLSLGDSLAQGYQPTGGPWSPTGTSGYNHGYPDELLKLTRAGYEHVYNLTGGIDAWADRVEPDMRRY